MKIKPIAWMKDTWSDVKQVFNRTRKRVSAETSEFVNALKKGTAPEESADRPSFLERLRENFQSRKTGRKPAYTVGVYRTSQRVQPFHWVHPRQAKIAARPEKITPMDNGENEIIIRPGQPIDLGPVAPINPPTDKGAALDTAAVPPTPQRIASAYQSTNYGIAFKLVEPNLQTLSSGHFDARA